jgi:hypothetical protein
VSLQRVHVRIVTSRPRVAGGGFGRDCDVVSATATRWSGWPGDPDLFGGRRVQPETRRAVRGSGLQDDLERLAERGELARSSYSAGRAASARASRTPSQPRPPPSDVRINRRQFRDAASGNAGYLAPLRATQTRRRLLSRARHLASARSVTHRPSTESRRRRSRHERRTACPCSGGAPFAKRQ